MLHHPDEAGVAVLRFKDMLTRYQHTTQYIWRECITATTGLVHSCGKVKSYCHDPHIYTVYITVSYFIKYSSTIWKPLRKLCSSRLSDLKARLLGRLIFCWDFLDTDPDEIFSNKSTHSKVHIPAKLTDVNGPLFVGHTKIVQPLF